jgi:hypothetical protein
MIKFINAYWDPYGGGIKTIVELLAYLLISFSFCFINYPIMSFFIPVMAVLQGMYIIYQGVQYRAGKAAYLLIPTKNSKTTSFIFGAVVVVAAIGCIWTKMPNVYPIIGICFGSLILLTAAFGLSGDKIRIENGKINIQPIIKDIDIRQLKEIEILPDHLLLTIYHERQRVGNLDIDSKTALMIVDYLNNKIPDSRLAIINSVPDDAISYA